MSDHQTPPPPPGPPPGPHAPFRVVPPLGMEMAAETEADAQSLTPHAHTWTWERTRLHWKCETCESTAVPKVPTGDPPLSLPITVSSPPFTAESEHLLQEARAGASMPYPVAPTSPEGFFNPHEEEWKGAILPQLRVPGADSQIQYKPARRRLDPERKSATRVLRLGTLKVYVTVGEYPDGTPGEIFLRAAKVGSIERGLLEALSLTVSLALQHGVPLADLTAKYRNLNFSPQGLTGDGEFPSVSSIVDYLGQWLESRYGK